MALFGPMILFMTILTMTNTWAYASNRPRPENPTEIKLSPTTSLRSKVSNDDKMDDNRQTFNAENFVRNYLKNFHDERISTKRRRSLGRTMNVDEMPFSTKRFEKMLEKAIVKIITGDLSEADVMLLKGLNYSLEEVLAIRERELGKKMRDSEIPEALRDVGRYDGIEKNRDADRDADRDERSSTRSALNDDNRGSNIFENTKDPVDVSPTIASFVGTKKSSFADDKKIGKNFDFDAYNKQAVYDYENVATKISRKIESDPFYGNDDYGDRFADPTNNDRNEDYGQTNVDRVAEPHVVFKIRWDDSEFDSASNERAGHKSRQHFSTTIGNRDVEYRETTMKNRDPNYRESTVRNRDAKYRESTIENRDNNDRESTIGNRDAKYRESTMRNRDAKDRETTIGNRDANDRESTMENRDAKDRESTMENRDAKDRQSTMVNRDENDLESTIDYRNAKDRESTIKIHPQKSPKSVSRSNSKLSNLGINSASVNHVTKPFHSSTNVNLDRSLPVVYRLGNFVNSHERPDDPTTIGARTIGTIEKIPKNYATDSSAKSEKSSTTKTTSMNDEKLKNSEIESSTRKNRSDDADRKSEIYEGLEWVEDDVYRVIPQALDALNYDSSDNNYADVGTTDTSNENRTSDLESGMFYDDGNFGTTDDDRNTQRDEQTQSSRNDPSTRIPISPTNLTTYQQLALAHRRDQGQKAIEDIKLKVLAMTGRFNQSSSSNQVQRERLTMFSPACQPPRNTDLETWSDTSSMNMYFQLNLTSGDHVVAAKMRIYKLPQVNVTELSNAAAVEEDVDEEKKIRISIYFYTKSLKKHRSKKRLMDSVVTPLTPQGSHLALDVRQAIRFWRQNSRSSSHANHGNNNHGLVIQVEDQEGKPLKPSQYIQQASCHTSEQNEDDKAYQRVPALFVQACSRYVRVVNGETVTYVNCGKSLRHAKH